MSSRHSKWFFDYQTNLTPVKVQNLFYWPFSTCRTIFKYMKDKEGFILSLQALDQNQKDAKCSFLSCKH